MLLIDNRQFRTLIVVDGEMEDDLREVRVGIGTHSESSEVGGQIKRLEPFRMVGAGEIRIHNLIMASIFSAMARGFSEV